MSSDVIAMLDWVSDWYSRDKDSRRLIYVAFAHRCSDPLLAQQFADAWKRRKAPDHWDAATLRQPSLGSWADGI